MSEREVSKPRARLSVSYIFPFIAIAAIAYATLVRFVGPTEVPATLDRSMFELTIASGNATQFLVRDAFILLILVLLFCEVWKAAVSEFRAVVNHVLSVLVAAICIYCFLRLDGFATTTFLVMTLAAIFDVVAGIYITWRTRPLHEPEIIIRHR